MSEGQPVVAATFVTLVASTVKKAGRVPELVIVIWPLAYWPAPKPSRPFAPVAATLEVATRVPHALATTLVHAAPVVMPLTVARLALPRPLAAPAEPVPAAVVIF